METTQSDPAIPDRDIRQREIASPERLAATAAMVVGTGAIGRQVALQLASIGVGTLVLVDPDTVGPENLAVQGFFEKDLDRLKTDAVRDTCLQLNHEISIVQSPERFKRTTFMDAPCDVIFVCVDSMESRRFIWNVCKDECKLFVDGRMVAEDCRVLVVRKPHDHAYYESTLFLDAEAYQGTCTAKTTLYCANVAAGIMVAQLTKLFRNIPYDRDVKFNILATELRFEDHQDQAGAEDRTTAA